MLLPTDLTLKSWNSELSAMKTICLSICLQLTALICLLYGNIAELLVPKMYQVHIFCGSPNQRHKQKNTIHLGRDRRGGIRRKRKRTETRGRKNERKMQSLACFIMGRLRVSWLLQGAGSRRGFCGVRRKGLRSTRPWRPWGGKEDGADTERQMRTHTVQI